MNKTEEKIEAVAEKSSLISAVESDTTKVLPRKKRFPKINLSIIPNTCTSMNLICGYLAIVMTSRGEFLIAGWLILIANIFDILDGRLARMASVESKFGAELDSLCDLVSFGVAPAFLVYTRYLEADRLFSLIVTCIFVLCGALRLARFNVTPHSKQGVFEGLPIPGGAGILATLTIFELQFGQFRAFTVPANAIPFIVLITSLLMVSKIEYPAIKKTPKTGNRRLIAVMLVIIALVANPPITLFVITWGFALYGLVVYFIKSVLRFYRRFILGQKKTPLSE
ncbi:MAG: CDP-diacylglycerol--serine O-phosphatidyltransferase [Candidatus Riflebacteria bacterium]|nr:CDP-diacylglycerol--serine O-phosphatidyltransferase [Candidatus Riflebacteria bacterium]